MIALSILGIGLITVATMFPIAWTKARDLADFTTQVVITDDAQTTIALLTRVSKAPVPPIPAILSSFLGDDDDGLQTNTDPWVHVLHLENISADFPWGPLPSVIGDFVSEPNAGTGPNPDVDLNLTPLANRPPVQVAFHDRVYPPLPPTPNAASTVAYINRWGDLLSQRRYAWAALHKLEYDPTIAGTTPTRADIRSMTVYVVTLRKGQATHRYARQDSTAAFLPAYTNPAAPAPPANATAPVALASDEDVIFPVAWRVEIDITDPSPLAGLHTPGTPGEAIVNPPGNPTNRFVTDIILRGSQLIDERSGKIYRVASRTIDPANPGTALLTFDEEITVADLDDDKSGALTVPNELIRTVWVFPPPIDVARDPNDNLPIVTGPQPVVGIEVRTMVYTP